LFYGKVNQNALITAPLGIKGASEILAQVIDSIAQWSAVADEAGVPTEIKKQIARTHRLQLSRV
jgi:hypothetical protein